MQNKEPILSTKIQAITPAGADHQVVTFTHKNDDGGMKFRKTPCRPCPWVIQNAGMFPAKAFEHSARTAYDMSTHLFSCHESGVDKAKICAGFLLRGADHNLGIRMAILNNKYHIDEVKVDDRELFDSYKDMAIANGVDEDHPALTPCR